MKTDESSLQGAVNLILKKLISNKLAQQLGVLLKSKRPFLSEYKGINCVVLGTKEYLKFCKL